MGSLQNRVSSQLFVDFVMTGDFDLFAAIGPDVVPRPVTKEPPAELAEFLLKVSLLHESEMYRSDCTSSKLNILGSIVGKIGPKFGPQS